MDKIGENVTIHADYSELDELCANGDRETASGSKWKQVEAGGNYLLITTW